MKVDFALNFIKDRLVFLSKREIINKFSAKDSEIKNNFEYYKDDALFFRHQFATINDEIILDTLFMEMVGICSLQTPIRLLIPKGEGSDIVRNLNDDYDIKRPTPLVVGGELEIDEPLAVASVYNTLATLGASEFNSKAKSILTEYEKNLALPNPKNVSTLAFRFSVDKTSWHSDYQAGDNYFSIYKNEMWGSAIPLISGSVGATNLTSLVDFPKTHEAGKFLRSTGSKLEWVDINSVGGGGGNNGGSTNPTTGDVVLEKIVYPPDGLNLSSGASFKTFDLKAHTEFKIARDSMSNDQISKNKEFKFIVELKNFNLTFKSGYVVMGNNSIFDFKGASATHAKFSIIKLDTGHILVYDLSFGAF